MSDKDLRRYSSTVVDGVEQAPSRAMLRAVGFTEEDFLNTLEDLDYAIKKARLIHKTELKCFKFSTDSLEVASIQQKGIAIWLTKCHLLKRPTVSDLCISVKGRGFSSLVWVGTPPLDTLEFIKREDVHQERIKEI